jgi:signal transduction histidine kinase
MPRRSHRSTSQRELPAEQGDPREGRHALQPVDKKAGQTAVPDATGVLEDLSEGLQVVDAAWRFVYFNTAARCMYAEQGIEADTLVGKHVFAEAFPRARDTPAGRAWRRAMTQRVVTEAESLDPVRQRSYVVRHFPMPDGGVSTFFRETTGGGRAEEALRGRNEDLCVQEEQWQTLHHTLQVRQEELDAAHDELQMQEEERCRESNALRELTATLESKVIQRTAELEDRARQLQQLILELAQADEHERRRVAMLLHEDVQQRIAGAKFELSLLSNEAKKDPSWRATITHVNEILGNVIGMSRHLSQELSPAVFCENDLAEVIEWLADQMQAEHRLTVQVHACGVGLLESEAMTLFLFRAARELLFHVVRHAGVHEARVRLRRRGRYVGLWVSDDGQGCDPQVLEDTAGFGLLGIRERVELLGGRMKIKTANGGGSLFRIIIPDGSQ